MRKLTIEADRKSGMTPAELADAMTQIAGCTRVQAEVNWQGGIRRLIGVFDVPEAAPTD